MSKRRILLVRHGETDHNKNDILMGQLPSPLNDLGRSQALGLGRSLKNAAIGAIWSSDLLRTRQTAEIVSDHIRYPRESIKYSAGFREQALGEWEDRIYKEVKLRPDFSEYVTKKLMNQGPPGGETRQQFSDRAVKAWNDTIQSTKGTLLIVAHGGTNRAILSAVTGITFMEGWKKYQQDNCCINEILMDKDTYELVRVN